MITEKGHSKVNEGISNYKRLLPDLASRRVTALRRMRTGQGYLSETRSRTAAQSIDVQGLVEHT